MALHGSTERRQEIKNLQHCVAVGIWNVDFKPAEVRVIVRGKVKVFNAKPCVLSMMRSLHILPIECAGYFNVDTPVRDRDAFKTLVNWKQL